MAFECFNPEGLTSRACEARLQCAMLVALQEMFKIISCETRFDRPPDEGNEMRYLSDHKDETRQRIVRGAARLFNRKGFTDVTIDEIMTEAGLTHGGFYRHFGGKDELYAEAVRHFIQKEVPELCSENLGRRATPLSHSRDLSSTPICLAITWRMWMDPVR